MPFCTGSGAAASPFVVLGLQPTKKQIAVISMIAFIKKWEHGWPSPCAANGTLFFHLKYTISLHCLSKLQGYKLFQNSIPVTFPSKI
jgi:hypothetical protein